MIITKYHASCDICHTATLEIKATMIHNAVEEIKQAGWTTLEPLSSLAGIDIIGDLNANPYLSRHACPDCQDKKDHERRGE